MKQLCIFFVLCVTALTVQANEINPYENELVDLTNDTIKQWASHPIVIQAVKEQNAYHENFSINDKRKLDLLWQQEKRKITSPLTDRVLEKPLSKYLMQIKEDSNGLYTEIIIIDSYGLNVGQTGISSHYWQEEQQKWINTFQNRSFATYVSDLYFNDTTEHFQVEIAFMLLSGDIPIGVVYVGVDIERL